MTSHRVTTRPQAPPRVLPSEPVGSLDDYLAAGGGRALAVARAIGPEAVIEEVANAGLRGRGGAGFPTGVKWRTVAENASADAPAAVVVNGAEGEPGTFKDRAILRANPHAVVEGALVAAAAVGADRVIFALKESFAAERRRLEQALAEARAAGWLDGLAKAAGAAAAGRGDGFMGRVEAAVATGPSSYLFGEETALLEVLDGRPPFPRLAPPFRHGVDEAGPVPDQPAGTRLAQPGPGGAPPALVNNVETIANVAPLLAEGAEWFRSAGTDQSPGTVVCTVSGTTRRHGVAEVELGTPLAEVIERIGGGPDDGRRLVAAMSGVSNALLPAALFDTPVTYEDLERVGSGLGSAGFIVFDDRSDLAAVAAGVSRFLGVESCGQCTPCKQDGLAIAGMLARVAASEANDYDLAGVADRVATVADEARCFLAHQHERVIDSVLRLFPDALHRHLDPTTPAVEPAPVAPIGDLGDDGRFVLDVGQLAKQPDWTWGPVDSGQAPAERLATRQG